MLTPRVTVVKMPIPKKKLVKLYKKEKNPRVKERLQAIILLSEGRSTKEVAGILKRSIRSVERWIKSWNEGGYEKLIPKFTGGPKPMLSKDEWEKVLKEIEGKGYSIREVMVYVNTTRGVNYTYKGVWEVIRRKKKVKPTRAKRRILKMRRPF